MAGEEKKRAAVAFTLSRNSEVGLSLRLDQTPSSSSHVKHQEERKPTFFLHPSKQFANSTEKRRSNTKKEGNEKKV
jgi:hypothetical protein